MNAPHKQSGDINNPNNFNNHKEASRDYVDGRQVKIYDKKSMDNVYRPYFSFIKEHYADFPKELLDKYFIQLEW
jgi:hypothetical protein